MRIFILFPYMPLNDIYDLLITSKSMVSLPIGTNWRTDTPAMLNIRRLAIIDGFSECLSLKETQEQM